MKGTDCLKTATGMIKKVLSIAHVIYIHPVTTSSVNYTKVKSELLTNCLNIKYIQVKKMIETTGVRCLIK